MTNAASRGVLIKGSRYLEALSRAQIFAFDKTGTLTVGQPVVTDMVDVCSCEECPDECGLQHAAALEVQSSHPLAQALVEEARVRGVAVPAAQNVSILSGRGIEGIVNGREVTVASHAHFDEAFPHEPYVCRRAEDLAAQGKTVVLVRHDDEVCAMFGIADAPRASSRRALGALKAEGMRTMMLTGDDPRVAQEIAREVGVDTVKAGLLPEEKVAAIAALSEAGETVVMVGDGVNDAPALARADVGVAMGAAGSAQAMETADVVLMGDDLEQLPFALRLSRRTKRLVTANIVFALAVKAVVFILALAGLATLWMAIVADVGASLAVILNGMRLRRMEP
jgi:Cd2+/Zn2+-exporting ATPase